MFGISQFAVQTRRIGLGLAAAAFALTALAAPASAAPNQPGDQPYLPLKADLQVTPAGKINAPGGIVYYKFNVKNHGPAAANNITAYREAHTYAIVGSGFALVNNTYFTLGNLAPGATMVYTVGCKPAAGMKCTQGTLMTLNNAYDPNNTNNMATIN